MHFSVFNVYDLQSIETMVNSSLHWLIVTLMCTFYMALYPTVYYWSPSIGYTEVAYFHFFSLHSYLACCDILSEEELKSKGDSEGEEKGRGKGLGCGEKWRWNGGSDSNRVKWLSSYLLVKRTLLLSQIVSYTACCLPYHYWHKCGAIVQPTLKMQVTPEILGALGPKLALFIFAFCSLLEWQGTRKWRCSTARFARLPQTFAQLLDTLFPLHVASTASSWGNHWVWCLYLYPGFEMLPKIFGHWGFILKNKGYSWQWMLQVLGKSSGSIQTEA